MKSKHKEVFTRNRVILKYSYKPRAEELGAIFQSLPPDAVVGYIGQDYSTGNTHIGFEHYSFPEQFEGDQATEIRATVTRREDGKVDVKLEF